MLKDSIGILGVRYKSAFGRLCMVSLALMLPSCSAKGDLLPLSLAALFSPCRRASNNISAVKLLNGLSSSEDTEFREDNPPVVTELKDLSDSAESSRLETLEPWREPPSTPYSSSLFS